MNVIARLPKRTTRPLDLSRTFIRRVDLRGAVLVGANLSFADCSNANFSGADFRDAILNGTILKGANLTDVRNLTIGQIDCAIIDENTLLPDGMR